MTIVYCVFSDLSQLLLKRFTQIQAFTGVYLNILNNSLQVHEKVNNQSSQTWMPVSPITKYKIFQLSCQFLPTIE